MSRPLKIGFAASEMAPLAKTGGLGDVAAALPAELYRAGHDVRPFLPFHRQISREGREFHRVEFVRDVPLDLGWRRTKFSLWTTTLPGGNLPLYLVDCPELFHRSHVYTGDLDEARRFAFFSRAVIESCQRMGWAPDVFHCNDWHTALIPLLLRTVYGWDSLFHHSRTLLTIHNIGYQGVFPAEEVGDLGLAEWAHLLDQGDLRAGRFNFLRTGIIYADLLTTVSPTYAREIQTPPYGMGVDDFLRSRGHRLVGILNGVDYAEWSPEKDRFIPHHYSRQRPAGKRKNKRYLLGQLGLPDGDRAPLFGVVSRMVRQKGFDLCERVLPALLAARDVRLIALGSGEPRYEEFFGWLQQHFPSKVVYHRGYHEELAHLIEAGADLFLMPSRYEPCGLNQLFSLRYGTIPVVRRTGGLADSVTQYDPGTGEGTGFLFDHFTPEGLHWAIDTALGFYGNKEAWRRLVRNAMAENYSWECQTARYVELYGWLRDA